jgi:hypothetical protein
MSGKCTNPSFGFQATSSTRGNTTSAGLRKRFATPAPGSLTTKRHGAFGSSLDLRLLLAVAHREEGVTEANRPFHWFMSTRT